MRKIHGVMKFHQLTKMKITNNINKKYGKKKAPLGKKTPKNLNFYQLYFQQMNQQHITKK